MATERADPDRLERHVRALEGVRHPVAAPDALGRAEDYVAGRLGELGLEVRRLPFRHRGRRHHNVLAVRPGRDPARPRVLVGAHFDTVPGSPGADDNASGVAALLETARIVAGRPTAATVEFAGFNLEEPQASGWEHRVGSRHLAAAARREGKAYRACLVFEMVGYTDPTPGSQTAPWLLFWKRVPDTGTFLAAVGDWNSGGLLGTFREAAARAAPDLPLVTHRAPFRGWLLPVTRLSDHSRFWDRGYPALMLTDTAFLRNPHYHRAGDRASTLDFEFMARVTDAAAEAVRRLAGRPHPPALTTPAVLV